jgi:predicted nucleic acid-binding protein
LTTPLRSRERVLVDTDVLIWYLRGLDSALRFLEELQDFSISAVTYMELVQGARNQMELRTLRGQLRQWKTPILPITEAISHRAVFYVEQHYLSHSLRLADALIAAAALEHGLDLATANDKHYKAIEELALIRYRP